MSYVSTNDSTFLSNVENWLQENGEVAVLIRYSAAGGSKSFEFYHSMQEFDEKLKLLAPKTCVIVFREKQLPLRGKVDVDFVSRALQTLPDFPYKDEYLIAGLELVHAGAASWYHFAAGTSLEEFKEDLSYCEGQMVAVGIYPDWLEDNDNVISAVIPEADGTVITGIY